MFLLKDLLLFSYLTALIAGAAVEFPTKTGWPNSASKSAYSRALGPPGGMDTITVPYMPKSPFFPKFVDPKMMISKKTDLLSNLFGGLGPVYPMGFKPFVPYAANGPSLYGAAGEAQLLNALDKNSADDMNGPYKRGAFGPYGAKPFGPMSPKFGPMGPKFGPMSKFSSFNTVPDYSMPSDFSRKRRSVDESSVAKLRSIMDGSKPETKNLGPPPPYPTLAPISEEPEEEVNALFKKMGTATAPKQYLPGFFGPFGPFGPMVDPSMFIAKKSAFLDTLFKNLATSTTPPPTEASFETSTTKSTIVPPDFWFPTSIIPSPTEYNDKVTDFLDKLFESLKLNKTTSTSESTDFKNDFARSLKFDDDVMQSKVARSIEDVSSINAAKDTIVDSILSELGDLKSNMVATMNDLITYQNSAASMSPKKPFKSFGPGMWPKPGPSGMLPFQQKMAILSKVFDMLTDLQKNITLAIQNAITAKMSSINPASTNYPFTVSDAFPVTNSFNMSLLDAIKQKLNMLDYGMPMSYNPSFGQFEPKVARSSSKGPSSIWVAYPENAAGIKRQVDSDTEPLINKDSDSDEKQQARSVKMQMHQGYQSLPAGAIESVQAGGGSVPGHQGGGIKLFDANNYEGLDQWVDWMEYLKNDYHGHRHHNHH